MNKSIILTDGPPGIGVTRMHYLTEKSFRETGGLGQIHFGKDYIRAQGLSKLHENTANRVQKSSHALFQYHRDLLNFSNDPKKKILVTDGSIVSPDIYATIYDVSLPPEYRKKFDESMSLLRKISQDVIVLLIEPSREWHIPVDMKSKSQKYTAHLFPGIAHKMYRECGLSDIRVLPAEKPC